MSHPVRYSDDDPYLTQLRELCLAFPGAQEKISHGRPNFYTTKVFASYGASVKGDHGSDRYARSLLVLPRDAERPALLDDERFFEPAYAGPYGWVGLDFTAVEPDWNEIAELIDESYRLTATKRLIAELDARH